MDKRTEKTSRTAFYSAYVQNIQPLFQEGKRVNTFVKIEETIFPQVSFSKMMGYANCLCNFTNETVSIDQIGKFKLAVNIPVEQPIVEFSLHDIRVIQLEFGKYFRNVGGNFVTLVDIVTKDQTYYFWVESLKVAHKIWHHEKFSSIKINVDQSFQQALDLSSEEDAVDAIRSNEENIPLFYG